MAHFTPEAALLNNMTLGRVIGASMLGVALVESGTNFGLQSSLFAGGGFLANFAERPIAVGLAIVAGTAASALHCSSLRQSSLGKRKPVRSSPGSTLLLRRLRSPRRLQSCRPLSRCAD